jgi:hypothetical protein
MSSSQALSLATGPFTYVPEGHKGLSAPVNVKNATPSVAANASASDSLKISAQAMDLYAANVTPGQVLTYNVAKALMAGASASAGSLKISDTAANISMQFDKLVAISAKISAITQTDSKAIALTEAQFSRGITANPENGLLYKINSNQFRVAISGVSTANLSAVASYGNKVVAVNVGDSSANIASKLADIAQLGTKVSSITQTSQSDLALSYASTVQYATTLNKIDKGSYKLNLTDTASNIKTNLAAITKMATKVSVITQTDSAEVITVNSASLTSHLATLKKINSGNFKIGIEDTAAAISKSWGALTSIQKNISHLKISDARPAFTLTASLATEGAQLIEKISNANLNLTVADSGANLSNHLSGLLALGTKVTQFNQTSVGHIAVSYSQLKSDVLTSFLGKLNPTSYSLGVSGADESNITDILANTRVKSVSLKVNNGTLKSSDADINSALQSSRITAITVDNAKMADLATLGVDKRVKSIAITDSASNLTNTANLTALDALMKKTKGIVSGLNVDSDSNSLISVSQATYTKYAATVFSVPKNYALEVDLGNSLALNTKANTTGGFDVQLWDSAKVKYGTAITLNKGVNFVKLGNKSTFLDSGDAKLNALLNVGSFHWQQNPNQAAAGTSSYALKPGVFQLGSGSANPTITYKFLSSVSDGKLSKADSKGFAPMSADQKSAVTSALNYVSSLVNINFKLIEDISTADINFGTNDQGNISGGYATGANPALGTVNLMMNSRSAVNTKPQPGDYGWQTIVHEIGHTLGLKHPGAYNAGGVAAPGPYLSATDDNQRNTVMSYKTPSDAAINWVGNGNGSYSNSGVQARTWMPLDILALQFLYGKNQTGTSLSDPSKSLADFQTTQFNSNWSGIQTISSAGKGLNLDLSQVSASNIVDMRAGAFSSINIKEATFNAGIGGSKSPQTFYNFNNVGLAYDASIRSMIGGTSNDVVYVSNNDVDIDGNAGSDTVYLYGSSSDWTQTLDSDQTIYTNGQVTAKLKNVESVAYYAMTSRPSTYSRIDLTA